MSRSHLLLVAGLLVTGTAWAQEPTPDLPPPEPAPAEAPAQPEPEPQPDADPKPEAQPDAEPKPEAQPDAEPQPDAPTSRPAQGGDALPPGVERPPVGVSERRMFEQRLFLAVTQRNPALFEKLILDPKLIEDQIELTQTPREAIDEMMVKAKASAMDSFTKYADWLRAQRLSADQTFVYKRIENGVSYGRFQRPLLERYDLLLRCRQGDRRYFVVAPIARPRINPKMRVTRVVGPVTFWRNDELLEITVERYEKFTRHLNHRYRLIPRSPSEIEVALEVDGKVVTKQGVSVPEDTNVYLDVLECRMVHGEGEEMDRTLRIELNIWYKFADGKKRGRWARYGVELPAQNIRFARDMSTGRRIFAGPGYAPYLFHHWYHERPEGEAPPRPNINTLSTRVAVRLAVRPTGPRQGEAFQDTAVDERDAPLVPQASGAGMNGAVARPGQPKESTPSEPKDPQPTDPQPTDPQPQPTDPQPKPTDPQPTPTDPQPTEPAVEPTPPEPEKPAPRPARKPPKDYIG